MFKPGTPVQRKSQSKSKKTDALALADTAASGIKSKTGIAPLPSHSGAKIRHKKKNTEAAKPVKPTEKTDKKV